MHNDEVVWQLLGETFCSFKVKSIDDNKFCKHPYNVTGSCNRVSCPLANGYYATVIEREGKCFLLLKTIEKCHMPSKMWNVIQLPNNFQEALEYISLNMRHIYKEHQIYRCKQRYTRLYQSILLTKKLQLEKSQVYVPIKKKTERRDAVRERKAEKAARIEFSVENELLKSIKEEWFGTVPLQKRTEQNKMEDISLEKEYIIDKVFESDISDIEESYQNDSYSESDHEGSIIKSRLVNNHDSEKELTNPEPSINVKSRRRKHRKLEYETEYSHSVQQSYA